MNRLMIIGNLTRDPELRTTQTGVSVCSFTVAVNRRASAAQRQNGQQPEADFFNVSAWRGLGENCAKWLIKGRKVAVVGSVSVRAYQRNDGTSGASMDVLASEVEFLTSAKEAQQGGQYAPETQYAPQAPQQPVDQQSGLTTVETDDLPF